MRAWLILLLLCSLTFGQGTITSRPEIATEDLVDSAIFFGLDNTGDATSYKVSLESLKETGVQVLNVVQYGADPTGVTDSTTAIRAAITAAAALEIGTTRAGIPQVYLPAGRYLVTDTLDVPDIVEIIGAGRYATTINFVPTAGSKACLYLGNAAPYHVFGRIADLAIRMQDATFDGQVAIKLENNQRTLIERVMINCDGISDLDFVGIQTVVKAESISVRDVKILAPVCIQLGGRVNSSTFTNIEYISDSTGGSRKANTLPAAAVLLNSDSILQHVTFDGDQVCVAKEHFLFYENASGEDAHGVSIYNLRTEAPVATTDTFTADNTTETFTAVGHGIANGTLVWVTTTGTIPAGLTVDKDYYIVNATADTFQLSNSVGGAAVAISSDGTGTHTVEVVKFAIHVSGTNAVHRVSLHNCRFQDDQPYINGNLIRSLAVYNCFFTSATRVLRWRDSTNSELFFDDACNYLTGCTADLSGSYKTLTLTSLRGSKTWPVEWFAGTTSPSISGSFSHYRTSNTGATSITTFNVTKAPKAGDVFTIDVVDNVTTFVHTGTGAAATMKLAGGANFAPTSGGTLVLLYNGTYFKEVSRTAF